MLSRFKVSVSVLVFSRLVNGSSEVWHWNWLVVDFAVGEYFSLRCCNEQDQLVSGHLCRVSCTH